MWKQPMLSIADKYELTLKEIDRLRLERAREQAGRAVLMQALATMSRDGMRDSAVDIMSRMDEAMLSVKLEDLVTVTLNARD